MQDKYPQLFDDSGTILFMSSPKIFYFDHSGMSDGQIENYYEMEGIVFSHTFEKLVHCSKSYFSVM